MNGLTPGQLSELHTKLQTRLADLQAQSGVHARADGEHDLPVSEVETSPADKATVRLLNDLALEAAGHHAAQMRALQIALEKCAEGLYGECEHCGNDIGYSRLQARPEARLCIACQTRAEKH